MSQKDIWLRFGTSTHVRKLSVREMSVGSFSNDDGDGNENVKKAKGLLIVRFFAVNARLQRENA